MSRYIAIDEYELPGPVHLLRIDTLPAEQATYDGEESLGVIACGATMEGDWAACNEPSTRALLAAFPDEICPDCRAAMETDR